MRGRALCVHLSALAAERCCGVFGYGIPPSDIISLRRLDKPGLPRLESLGSDIERRCSVRSHQGWRVALTESYRQKNGLKTRAQTRDHSQFLCEIRKAAIWRCLFAASRIRVGCA